MLQLFLHIPNGKAHIHHCKPRKKPDHEEKAKQKAKVTMGCNAKPFNFFTHHKSMSGQAVSAGGQHTQYFTDRLHCFTFFEINEKGLFIYRQEPFPYQNCLSVIK
jgi:hypothetical protein